MRIILCFVLISVTLLKYLGHCERGHKDIRPKRVFEKQSSFSQLFLLDEKRDNCTLSEFDHESNQGGANTDFKTSVSLENKSSPDVQNTLIGMKWIPVILFCVLCLVSYGVMTCTTMAKKLNKFPGEIILPFIGSFYIAFVPHEKISEHLSRTFQRHGRTFRLWLLHQPTIVIAEASSIQAVTGFKDEVQKAPYYKDFGWIFGNGLITSEAEVWKHDRKLLNPSFKYQRYDGFLAAFNKHSKVLIKILEERFKGRYEPINLHPLLSTLGMDLISDSALGITTSYQSDTQDDFVKNSHLALDSFRSRILRPWIKIPVIWHLFRFGKVEEKVQNFFKNNFIPIIENRKKLNSSSNKGEVEDEKETRPFIDALITAGKSDADIIEHVTTIFGGGFETTASGMNYTLFLLAVHQKHQVKIQEELDEIFALDQDRDVTFDDLAKMKYLEMCIKEAIRIYTPIPFIGRTPLSEIKLENGLAIPKGCQVIISIFDLHRDPRVFPDPETFNPHRFQPEACAKRNNYAYMPFATGPRNCIGQKYAMLEMKTVLSYILRKFNVRTECTREKLKVIYGVVLEPAGSGIQLILTKREEKK